MLDCGCEEVALPVVLICAPDPLGDELHGTLLWREGMERHVANRFEDALTIAFAAHPHLIVVDRDLPQSIRLVENLRSDTATRDVSIVVVARGEFQTEELLFLEAGANAVLRLPAGPALDERLSQLMQVPARRMVRLRVRLQLEGRTAPLIETAWGTVASLSASGMLVESPAAPSVGADLDFSLWLPGSSRAVTGCGQVVRLAAPGQFGVRFYGLEGDGLERVRRFAEERGPQDGVAARAP